jgi:N-methylhydantoinase A
VTLPGPAAGERAISQVGVDVGGTFTDVVSIRDGVIQTTKVPTNVVETERSVLEGAAEVGVADAAVFNHASTHGLNAIITRRLPKVGLLTTAGHRDVLDVGRSWRPAEAPTDPHWRRSFGDVTAPLVPRYLRRTIDERITAAGEVFRALDEDHARAELQVLARCNVQGVAICLINSYVNSAHEDRLRELVAEELGEIACSVSSHVSPLSREYPRTSTTVVDVLMKIIYGPYADRLHGGLRDLGFGGQLNFGDCAAMLAPVEVAMDQPSRVVFSGPAAGTTASAHFGDLIAERNLLCVDVGGTSSDVSVVTNGRPIVNTTVELEHDLVVNTLSNEITSVGAGGGSIVSIGATGEIRVGPDSAGADPGPACYGRGGTQPTTTDTCLLIGILSEASFVGGKTRLDRSLAREAFAGLDTELPVDTAVHHAFNIALNNIAEGAIDIVVKNGVDPREFSLIAYGAAGPMLLPAALDLINARQVIVPPHPGIFSAVGLLSADMVFVDSRSAYLPLVASSAQRISALYEEMERAMREQLGDTADEVEFQRSFDARLAGQAFETPFVSAPSGPIDAAAVAAMVTSFHDAYQERSGNRFESIPIEGVTYRLHASVATPKAAFPPLGSRNGTPLVPRRELVLEHIEEQPVSCAEYDRADLCHGDVIQGAAIIREDLATTYVTSGQVAEVGAYGELYIRRST